MYRIMVEEPNSEQNGNENGRLQKPTSDNVLTSSNTLPGDRNTPSPQGVASANAKLCTCEAGSSLNKNSSELVNGEDNTYSRPTSSTSGRVRFDIVTEENDNYTPRLVDGGARNENICNTPTPVSTVSNTVINEQRTCLPRNFSGRIGSGSENHRYVEFMQGHVPCPTCRGLGRIPKVLEKELVAIIPVGDARLKPRRTIVYVMVTLMLCMLLSGLVLFFVLPRDMQLVGSTSHLYPNLIIINSTTGRDLDEGYMLMQVTNSFTFENNNFYAAHVSGIDLSATLYPQEVGLAVDNVGIDVPMRSQIIYSIPINLTFSGPLDYWVKVCTMSKRPQLMFLSFQLTANISALNQASQSSVTTAQYVKCSNGTVAPLNTRDDLHLIWN